jgi:hypothetical protein
MRTIRALLDAPRVRLVAGIVGLLAIGAVLGAVISTAVPALAANQGAGTRTAVTSTGPQKYCQVYERTLETQLKVSQQQLESANQAALDAALQQAVADGKLTQAQATQIEQGLAKHDANVCAHLAGLAAHHPGAPGAHGPAPAQGRFLDQARAAVVQAVATELHLTPATLKADLAGGQNIVALAAQHGVTQAQLNTTILASARTQLDSLVTAGTITSAQESKVLAALGTQLAAGNYGLVGLGPMGASALPPAQ